MSILKSLLFVAQIALLFGCSAYDLGSVPPLHIQVVTVNATYENGVGVLLQQKCMSCHSKVSPSAPANTPYKDLGTKAGAIALKDRIRQRVFVEQTMPPKFGTPLYDDERLALLSWLTTLDGAQK